MYRCVAHMVSGWVPNARRTVGAQWSARRGRCCGPMGPCQGPPPAGWWFPDTTSRANDPGYVTSRAAEMFINPCSSGAVQRPPVRRRRNGIQRWVTRSRCRRNTVAGVTIRCWSAAWFSNRLSAANTARSAHGSRGRRTWRRNAATSAGGPDSPRSSIVRYGPGARTRPLPAGE
jgi:hypothetical protein